jgi:hypothetical protein
MNDPKEIYRQGTGKPREVYNLTAGQIAAVMHVTLVPIDWKQTYTVIYIRPGVIEAYKEHSGMSRDLWNELPEVVRDFLTYHFAYMFRLPVSQRGAWLKAFQPTEIEIYN